MKYIITEDQYKRLNKSSQLITNAIEKYMNYYILEGERKITPKSRNYGNLREDWCIDGKETIHAFYYFEKGKFDNKFMNSLKDYKPREYILDNVSIEKCEKIFTDLVNKI